jgi:hypothetical protein
VTRVPTSLRGFGGRIKAKGREVLRAALDGPETILLFTSGPMQTRLLPVIATLMMNTLVGASPHPSSQQPTPPDSEGRAASPASRSTPTTLVGLWRSADNKLPLTGAFEESVWGRNASSVRTVELDVRQSGQAVLKVTTRVVDARGRVVRGSTALEETRLTIGKPGEPSVAGIEYEVMVVGAERRYPDDPTSKWPLDGLKVRLLSRDGGLELRYDTPEGRGSFWETLRRQVAQVKKPAPPS